MAAGVEWVSNNNNSEVPGSSGWQLLNVDAYFSAPEDIEIVIMQVINTNSKTVGNWGVRHPDESTAAIGALAVLHKSLLFCGAKDTGGAGARCQVGTYRSAAQSVYSNRILGGIKSDSCIWDQTPFTLTTSAGAAWEEINIYGSSPPTDATFAIIEVRAGGAIVGFRHPDDSSSSYFRPANILAHFLAPIRKDSSTEYYIEVYSNVAATMYVRGFIRDTNPGIFNKAPIAAVTVSTSEADQSIAQAGYVVTGGFFVGYSLSAVTIRAVDPDWTNNDEWDVNGLITLGCSADSSENVEVRVENIGQAALGLVAFTGSIAVSEWPHDLGGVGNANIGKVGGVDKANIGKIGGVS